jgi:DNA polymerase-1
MIIIKTQDLDADPSLDYTIKNCVYCGLDCCITAEVLDKTLLQLRPETRVTYDFSRKLQGPILEMNTRGMRVDEERRQALLRQYREEVQRLADQLNRIIREGVGFQFEIGPNRKHDWPSDQQLCKLFYDYMGIPAIFKLTDEGERRLTVDRKALEKLEGYFYAEPIVRHLYVLREHAKKTQFLSTAVDNDGRLRTSFNIAGTTTGRLASSLSDMGTGTNLQNVENRLRAIFIADPGYKFCNIDLEQSDARVCGAIHWNLFRDSRYLDLCESGDLHTGVARICFNQLHWTNNNSENRRIADGRFYREFSYRDATKRLGHGTNYQGEPAKMSRETHIPVGDIVRFQRAYLPNFAFERWWEWVDQQIKSSGVITTMLGRRRKFFGHPKDPDTIRAAIAYEPQSVTADTINRGMLAVWLENRVQMLLQVHDSILFQFPEEQEDEIVPLALGLVQQKLVLKGGREFMIPAEAKTGWNWSDRPSPEQIAKGRQDDPDALMKWPEKETRKRTRT